MKFRAVPNGFIALWLCFSAAYLVWMCFFLRWDTYPLSETGMLHRWVYPVWTAASTVLLGMFIVYMRRFLYTPKHKSDAPVALALLLFDCVFVTWYGFFKNPRLFTASMIGLEYPWHFKMWGVFTTAAVFINLMYLYRKYNYRGRFGLICACVGCAVLFVTINVPSAGEDLILNSLRCMSHWTGALMFALGSVAAVIAFLVHMCKTGGKRFLLPTVLFSLLIAAMLTLLITVGKDGLIENIPLWAMTALMLLLNFTSVFPVPQAAIEPSPDAVCLK